MRKKRNHLKENKYEKSINYLIFIDLFYFNKFPFFHQHRHDEKIQFFY